MEPSFIAKDKAQGAESLSGLLSTAAALPPSIDETRAPLQALPAPSPHPSQTRIACRLSKPGAPQQLTNVIPFGLQSPDSPAEHSNDPPPAEQIPTSTTPFEHGENPGVATHLLSEHARDEQELLTRLICSNAPGSTVGLVYRVRNALHLIQFYATLLFWATELVNQADVSHSDSAPKRIKPSLSSSIHALPAPVPAAAAAAAAAAASPASSALHVAAASAGGPVNASSLAYMFEEPFSQTLEEHMDVDTTEVPLINSLTAATLALRTIRHEYMVTRDASLFDSVRLQRFTAQADRAIVEQLRSIDWKPDVTLAARPPPAIRSAIGLSEELCVLANIQLLYHTPGVAPERLLVNGIDIRYSKIGSYGRGAYFSDNSLKAMTYFRPEWGVKPDQHHPDHRYMVVSLVAMGRVKAYPGSDCDQTLFREPDGFDSVIGTPRDQREVVVFNPGRVLLSYIVYYKISEPPPPPRPVPGGVMIPSALKAFFTQLIARAESVQLGPDIRGLISDLLKSKIEPTEFVARISTTLNAPPPSELIQNLEMQLKRVRSTTTPAAPAAAAAAAATAAAATADSKGSSGPVPAAAAAVAAAPAVFSSGTASRLSAGAVTHMSALPLDKGLFSAPTMPTPSTSSPVSAQPMEVSSSSSSSSQVPRLAPFIAPALTAPAYSSAPTPAAPLQPILPSAPLPAQSFSLGQPFGALHALPAAASPLPLALLVDAAPTPPLVSGSNLHTRSAPDPSPLGPAMLLRQHSFSTPATTGSDPSPLAAPFVRQSLGPPPLPASAFFPAQPLSQSSPLLVASSLVSPAAAAASEPGSGPSATVDSPLARSTVATPTGVASLGTADSALGGLYSESSSMLSASGSTGRAPFALGENLNDTTIGLRMGSTQSDHGLGSSRSLLSSTLSSSSSSAMRSKQSDFGSSMAPLPSTPGVAAQTRKATVVLPKSLKAFFEDIKGRVKLPGDKSRVDQGIFDLIGGTIGAEQFLMNMGKLMGATPPPELATQLDQQLAMARFKCDAAPSASTIPSKPAAAGSGLQQGQAAALPPGAN